MRARPWRLSEALRVAAGLAAHEERDLAEFLLGVGRPSERHWGCLECGRRQDDRLRGVPGPEMRGGVVAELRILPEHADEMLFEPHHQRVDPRVEDDVGALEPHLRRVAGREVLDVDRGGDDRARDAEALRDMALHLRAEDELRLQGDDPGLDLEVVVGDQRLDAVQRGSLTNLPGHLAAVGAEADDREAELAPRDAGGRDRVGRVAEDEDALAREVGRVDRARVPGQRGRALGEAGADRRRRAPPPRR
jgi:hypothetical protein